VYRGRVHLWAIVVVVAAGCGRIEFDRDPSIHGDCTTASPGESCVSLQLGAVTWAEAGAACAQLSPPAHLARMTSAEDNAIAAGLAATIPFGVADTNTNQRQRMWLGGNSLGAVGVWVWETGEPFTYTNWRPGEPGSPDAERCMVVLGSQDGVWDDRPCDLRYDAFLCERP